MNKLVVLIFLLLFSCDLKQSQEENLNYNEEGIAVWPNVVMYEIFVQSFADSDGDSIGDINGMISKLDYLKDLGIKGIWLMPIMPSPSYHKYDVTDYKAIHPDYGNLETFKKFVDEAHARDIKVVIDMIINHSSNKHPWFINSKTGENAEYRDYYIWATDNEIEKISAFEKEESGDSGNINQWHDAANNSNKFYGFFSGMMPDLNYDNPKVRREVIDIGKFWIEEIGIDGFRLDAAKHIYEDSRVKDNQNWWKKYRAELEKINPDIYLVGEVWDNTEFTAPFLHGLPALFNFDLAFSMLESVKREKSVTAFISGSSRKIDESTSFVDGYLQNQRIYREETNDFYDAIFLSNHDQNRVLSSLSGDIKKGKLAAAILLTMPGTPYLYYGEEIGMLGMKPDPNIREPFLWTDAQNDSIRTKWIQAEFSLDRTVQPLSAQISDENSIYNHYKKLIYARNHTRALTFGNLENANYGSGNIISYYRTYKKSKLLIVHNLGSQRISTQLKTQDKNFTNTIFSTYGENVSQSGFDLEAYSSIIINMEESY